MVNTKRISLLHGQLMKCGHDTYFNAKLRIGINETTPYVDKSWCAACFAEWASKKFPIENMENNDAK